MKFRMNKIRIFCLLLWCVSCGDADLLDPDKWTQEIDGWEPAVKLQVLQGEFTFWDLINQGKDSVIIKEGNELVIQYLEKDIYNMQVADVFDMPAENVAFLADIDLAEEVPGYGGIILPEPVHFSRIFSQSLSNIPVGCELNKIVASSDLNYTLPETGFEYTVEALFGNIQTEDGEPLKIIEKVGREEFVSKNRSFENLVVNLSKDDKIDLQITMDIPAGQELTSLDIALIFNLDHLSFSKAEGKIVVTPIEIEPGEFNMKVDFLDEIEGTFKFAKPELNIILRNKGIGIPMGVDATFDGSNGEGKKLTLALNQGEKLETNGNLKNSWEDDTLGLNASNSNIVDFLSLPPQGDIHYKGTVEINPDLRDDNVIYQDAEVTLDAYVRIPFSLSAEKLIYRDTLDDIDIDQKYANKIKKGELSLKVTNGLPLSLSIAVLTLLDEAGNVLDQLQAVEGKDLVAAAVGAKPGESNILFALTQEQAKKLGQTENILLEIVAFTPQNTTVTINADATLAFKLLLTATAVITDLDDF